MGSERGRIFYCDTPNRCHFAEPRVIDTKNGIELAEKTIGSFSIQRLTLGQHARCRRCQWTGLLEAGENDPASWKVARAGFPYMLRSSYLRTRPLSFVKPLRWDENGMPVFGRPSTL
jgi:hypothetical protein